MKSILMALVAVVAIAVSFAPEVQAAGRRGGGMMNCNIAPQPVQATAVNLQQQAALNVLVPMLAGTAPVFKNGAKSGIDLSALQALNAPPVPQGLPAASAVSNVAAK